jgi:hypothetical protein
MANNGAAIIEEIQKRSAVASESELYRDIAGALPAAERAQFATAAALTPTDLLAIGREFYTKRLRPQVYDIICGKLKYCDNRHVYDSAAEIVGLVANGVGEALASAYGIPSAVGGSGGKLVVAVSAAVLKEGLNNFCGCV